MKYTTNVGIITMDEYSIPTRKTPARLEIRMSFTGMGIESRRSLSVER